MTKKIEIELSYLCQKIGARIPVWTQGAGGNISIKEDKNTLWIKATGFRLDRVTENTGIAHVDYKTMAQVLKSESWKESEAEENYAKLIKETTLLGDGLGRASMETGFHALLPKKYVLHFHSLASLLFYHEFNMDRTRVIGWLKNNTQRETIFVEACRPGWVLSKQIKGDAGIYFLESHGIILHGDDDSIITEWESLEKEFCKDFNYSGLYSLLTEIPNFDKLFQLFAANPMPFRCFFPDVAVFSERLDRVLQPTASGEVFFPVSSISKDKDMAELWLATAILYRLSPNFQEVPKEIRAVIRDLPTEKLRQQRELPHG